MEPISQENRINIIHESSTGADIGIIEFSDDMTKKILSTLQKSDNDLETKGDVKRNSISPTIMQGLLGAAGLGSIALQGNAVSKLYMATGDPSTLMKIKDGVGSAVMKSTGGIGYHAPFKAVGGLTSLSIVAPTAIMAIGICIVVHKLNQITKSDEITEKLDEIKKAVYEILEKLEAQEIGTILSVSNRLQGLYQEYAHSHHFTGSMKSRLIALEQDINPIAEEYKYSYSNKSTDSKSNDEFEQNLRSYLLYNLNSNKLKQNLRHHYLLICCYLIDIKVDVLQLQLTLQENPNYIEDKKQKLQSKLNDYIVGTEKIVQEMEGIMERLSLGEIGYIPIAIPIPISIPIAIVGTVFSSLLGSNRERLESERSESERLERSARERLERLEDFKLQFYNPIKSMSTELHNLKETFSFNNSNVLQQSDKQVNLIYWKDENGVHSYYTDEVQLES